MLNRLFHPSAGLGYQWRAIRYRKSLWAPFTHQVAQWLANWQPATQHLVVIGPNAGYTLNADFLARFTRITLIEPDPIARILFKRRFPQIQFQYTDLDCFANTQHLHSLPQHFPQAAFLFTNVIGQMLTEDMATTWRKSLGYAMHGRSWASYHDVISTKTRPRYDHVITDLRPLDQILTQFWPVPELEIHDHLTFQLGGKNLAHDYTTWSLTPHQHHLIEWWAAR